MSVDGVQQALQQGLARLDQGLVFKADSGFASTLTIGQIIKGKVLRHFDGSRYAVSFGGQERVVDSAIPLRSGEIIHGRVVGLDDKVHLQRVATAAGGEVKAQPDTPVSIPARGGDVIEQLFLRHRASLSEAEQSRIHSLGRALGNVDVAAQSALVLRKLGLALDPTLIRSVARALLERGETNGELGKQQATALEVDHSQALTERNDAVQALANALANMIKSEPSSVAEPGLPDTAERVNGDTVGGEQSAGQGQDQRQRHEWRVGRWLLNVQQDGALQHRFTTLPLWLGDRLVEVNMAFFSQQHSAVSPEGVRRQRVVFSLNMQGLGLVNITINLADRRLGMTLAAEHEQATQALAAYLGELKSGLSEHGWEVDEINYVTGGHGAGAMDAPTRRVVEHHVRQDSLSRLL